MRKFPIPSVEFLDCLNQLAWIFCFLWPIIITLSRSEAKVTFMSPGINLPSRYQSSVGFIAPSKDRDSLDAVLKLHRPSNELFPWPRGASKPYKDLFLLRRKPSVQQRIHTNHASSFFWSFGATRFSLE